MSGFVVTRNSFPDSFRAVDLVLGQSIWLFPSGGATPLSLEYHQFAQNLFPLFLPLPTPKSISDRF